MAALPSVTPHRMSSNGSCSGLLFFPCHAYSHVRAPQCAPPARGAILEAHRDNLVIGIHLQHARWTKSHADAAPFAPLAINPEFFQLDPGHGDPSFLLEYSELE
jgi:hypothetical protein